MNDKDPTTTQNAEGPIFDVSAAERERLNWRLGGEQPTERALGLDENKNRIVADEIKAKLGEDALNRTESEQ